MKVLLLKNVEDLGTGGDVCDVSKGYARNYLFPRKLALKATKNALIMAESLHKKALEEQKKINSEAEYRAEKLSAYICEIIASTDDDGHLYGGVSERTISDKLIEAGFEVDSGHVLLHEHIKQVGEFKVPIKVYGDIRADITVIVKSDNKDVVFVKPITDSVEEDITVSGTEETATLEDTGVEPNETDVDSSVDTSENKTDPEETPDADLDTVGIEDPPIPEKTEENIDVSEELPEDKVKNGE